MGKIKKYIFIVFLLFLTVNKVDALSVSKNDLTIEKGKNETVELYANVETFVTSVDFTLVFSTYDVPAYFSVNSNFQDTNPNGIAHKIVFSEPQTGKILLGTVSINIKDSAIESTGTVNIHSGKATTESGESINLNIQNINIKVETTEQTIETEPPKEEMTQPNNPVKQETPKQEEKEEEEIENASLLEKIESNIVKVELKENVFEYTLNIEEEVEELDLKAIPKEESYKVDITTQKIKELSNNQIIVTIKNGDIEEKYTFNIKVGEKSNIEEIEIDNQEFNSETNYKGKWTVVIIVLAAFLFVGLLLIKKK